MTNNGSSVEEIISPDQAHSLGVINRLAGALKHHWGVAAIVALALLVWLPRLSGPIDLRWDAGVYYLLGTSLADGHGYRIPSEPGAPEAVQYPPLLPAFVAGCELALGSTDPLVVGRWLRGFYAALFLGYGLAVLHLARRYLQSTWALGATVLCLLQLWTLFLSDLLFAELPFALVSVLFALVMISRASYPSWAREVGLFTLAAAGFFLRTAGLVLFAAWVIDALIHRRWRVALSRALLGLLPVFFWQANVERVRRSDEYRHPAYEYQRAAYQNYNVTYADNMLLADPFRPERGIASRKQMAARIIRNITRIPSHLGQAISAPEEFWQTALPSRRFGRSRVSAVLVAGPILGLGLLVIGGLFALVRLRAWTLTCIVLLSIALMCLTPWPEEFHRYLMPVAAFLAIGAVFASQQLYLVLQGMASRVGSIAGRVALIGLVVLALLVQTRTALRLLYSGSSASFAAGAHFFHDRDWTRWEQAVTWLRGHAAAGDIVATAAPHQVYLRTGLRAVYPPFEADAAQARRQLESVPVKYVLVDEFKYRDFSRHYALPAVEGDPAWRLVHANERTKIFEHTAGPSVGEGAL